jgi:hypothetical protein
VHKQEILTYKEVGKISFLERDGPGGGEKDGFKTN